MTPQDTLILLHIPLSAQAATQGPVPSKALGDQLDGQGQGQGRARARARGRGRGTAGQGQGISPPGPCHPWVSVATAPPR